MKRYVLQIGIGLGAHVSVYERYALAQIAALALDTAVSKIPSDTLVRITEIDLPCMDDIGRHDLIRRIQFRTSLSTTESVPQKEPTKKKWWQI